MGKVMFWYLVIVRVCIIEKLKLNILYVCNNWDVVM